MKTKKYKYSFIHLLAIALFASSCGQGDDKEMEVPAGEVNKEIQAVEVVKPKERSFKGEVLITGTANANQKVTLYAMEGGYVKNIRKDIGDVVRKGELIAILANPQLVSDYERTRAQLKAKQSNFERLNSTHANTPAITPLYMVEEAEAEYLSLKAALSAIQHRLNFLRVKAPFSGIITQRFVDNGALIQSGLTEDNPQSIVELQDVSSIRVIIPLPESDIGGVNIGTEVEVSFPELPGEAFNTSVTRLAGALDPASKTMQVEIDLNNTQGRIKPGMYAKVLLQTSSRVGVISLPINAQLVYQNQFFVLVVKDGMVERIPLRKGLSNKDFFEVLNPEITESSLVIVQGKGLVRSGQKVKTVIKAE
jgi:RND family efflux transporter MFP subunit